MLRIFLLITGFVSLALGIWGILVPLLPTTPFLLLSTACFLKSSKKMHHWLTHHRVFGLYIRAYMDHRAIAPASRFISLILLWVSILFAIIWVAETLWLRILLLCIALGVSIHLSRLSTLDKDTRNQLIAVMEEGRNKEH